MSLLNSRILDLSNIGLSRICTNLSVLDHLIKLDLSDNYISTIPDELFNMTSLQELDLSNNEDLCRIPEHFTKLVCLRVLLFSMDSNQKVEAPWEIISNITNLEISECSEDALEELADKWNKIPLEDRLTKLSQLSQLEVNNYSVIDDEDSLWPRGILINIK